MILVGRLLSPFVRRTAILLDTLGLPFELRPISAVSDQEELRRVNPLGRVPALVEGDRVLVDSVAIALTLLDRHDPQGRLWPRGGEPFAEALQILFLANGACEKFVAAYYERTRRPGDLVHEPWIAHCESQALGGLRALEERLALREEGGVRPDYLDMVVATTASFIRGASDTLYDPAAMPRLEATRVRCEAMPVFDHFAPR